MIDLGLKVDALIYFLQNFLEPSSTWLASEPLHLHYTVLNDHMSLFLLAHILP